ncbi:hypothetical protein [Dyadobacter sp. CY312]|uniref:hypothetical protein n=1 Tax=Dyadobacter sp. CY312 TaxID=2907303 RepID=UPI001F22CA20|nr:hypothetical protein [Dyadobacter sp. CY312]MCE7038776.1 hypothetical protein [Dyadobacter sp. CY312]
MKNAKNMIAAAMMVLTIATYANANTTINTSVEEKGKVSVLTNTLPATLPVLETPAPQVVKSSNDTNKQNAVQKAAIVELQLKSQSAK